MMLKSVALDLRARTWQAFFFLIATLFVHPITTGEVVAAHVELFEFEDFALYVPARVSAARGILLALGGPDTRAFVSGGPFGAPNPELEASLQILGQELRTLAEDHGLAILGTSQAAMTNTPESDELIMKAIHDAAIKSGRPELASAPLFLYGISGGTLQASGFTARNPGRVGALFLKVPGPPESLSSAEALAVPTYMVLAERESIADNRAVIAAFAANRRAGALWALAIEPGVAHHSLKPSHRAVTINWMRTIVELRIGASSGDPLQAIAESSGWLGNPLIGVESWANYTGDRRSASWFPSQATAEEWKAFVEKRDVR